MMKRERQYEILADRCPGIGTEQEYRYILTVSSEALDKKGMTFEEFENIATAIPLALDGGLR